MSNYFTKYLEPKKKPDYQKPLQRWQRFLSRLLNTCLTIIFIFLMVESIMFLFKYNSSRPDERMCFDYSHCFNYCATFKGARCLVPTHTDTTDVGKAWKLLLTGRRNLLEILNPNQGYCACEYEIGGDKKIKVLHQFYIENN